MSPERRPDPLGLIDEHRARPEAPSAMQLTVVLLVLLTVGKHVCNPGQLEVQLGSLAAEIRRAETSSAAVAITRGVFEQLEGPFLEMRNKLLDGKSAPNPCVVQDSMGLFSGGAQGPVVGAYDLLLQARVPELLVAASVRGGQICLLRSLAIRNHLPLRELGHETASIYGEELLSVAEPFELCASSMFRDALRAAELMGVQGAWPARAKACLSCVDDAENGATCLMAADRTNKPEEVLRCLGVSP